MTTAMIVRRLAVKVMPLDTTALYSLHPDEWGGDLMRASSGVFAAALFMAGTHLSEAATLSPKEIQGEFFNGKPFTASTSSNTKFTMVFTGDGKVTRKPQGTTGVGGEGTWKLSKEGFCTTWRGSNENCYTLMSSGERRWSVMKGKSNVGTWSK